MTRTIVLNFSHALTDAQRAQLAEKLDCAIDDCEIVNIKCQFDMTAPFAPQVDALVSAVPFTADELRRSRVLLVPPALSAIGTALLAALIGRMGGYLPQLILVSAVPGETPTRYQVAAIIDLNSLYRSHAL